MMSKIDWVAMILVIVGGLNWGLIAINSSWNVVTMLLGSWPIAVTVVYGLIGLSALYSVYHLFMNK